METEKIEIELLMFYSEEHARILACLYANAEKIMIKKMVDVIDSPSTPNSIRQQIR
jgi:hypothetical protein